VSVCLLAPFPKSFSRYSWSTIWIVYPEDISGQLNFSSCQSSVTSSGTGSEHQQVFSKQSHIQKNKSNKFYNFYFKHFMNSNT